MDTILMEAAALPCAGGRIRRIGRGRPPRGGELVDARGGYITPGFVDIHGRIISASELFVKGHYRATLALSHQTTIYTRWGDWLPRLCVLIALALLLAARFTPGRRTRLP